MTKNIDNYPKYLEQYKSTFEPIFAEAKRVSDFNLILSLIAVRGASDAGWNAFDNTLDVFNELYIQNDKFEYSLRINVHLWMYVHLVECSEHYELLANLIKSSKGEDYIIANNKNKDYVNLKVSQKIDRLKKIASGTNFKNVIEPFEDSFNSRLRNAIGHADYAIKQGSNGGVTVVDDSGFPMLFQTQEIDNYINKAMALHVAIRQLRDEYIGHYKKSITIKSSKSFGGNEEIDVTLIVRKSHGVIGIRCIGGYDLGQPFETRLVKAFPDEMSLINDGVNELPEKE
ncbi:MAG: hypothetical protein V4611_04545 [Patescibacteria group bacterium]